MTTKLLEVTVFLRILGLHTLEIIKIGCLCYVMKKATQNLTPDKQEAIINVSVGRKSKFEMKMNKEEEK